MDSFLGGLAKQGFDAYSNSGNENDSLTKTGGHEFNSPPHGSGGPPWLDEEEVVKKASSEGSGDSSMFSSALGFINSDPKKHHEPIDEEVATEAHRKVYSEGSTSGMNANSMGMAAAMEVMKKFTGGDKNDSKKPSSKKDLISLAMAEASKMFDKSGGSTHGGKQDAVNSAGMTIMKMMVQSKFSGTTGGKDSGGLGGLMSMAGKFMK